MPVEGPAQKRQFKTDPRPTARQALAAAGQWLDGWRTGEGGQISGFLGAYVAGSVTVMPADDRLPASSDVDISLVVEEPPPQKLGKFLFGGALLEVSFVPAAQLQSAGQILGHFQVAPAIASARILADPSGHLTRLQLAVARAFARQEWVERRCAHAQEKSLHFLAGADAEQPFHQRVSAWLFGTSLTTHVLLAAGLRPPTVRKRYVAARALLAEHNRLDFYEELLGLLGCSDWTPTQTARHLQAVAAAFDAASKHLRTPYRFAADLSPAARPVAIDGSRELIVQGLHREAVYWLVATSARCQWVFGHDAPPAVQARFRADFRALLAELGIENGADLQARSGQVRQFLPRLGRVAEEIMTAELGD